MEIVSFLAAHRGNRSLLAPVSEAGAQELVGGVLYFQPIYCSVEKGASDGSLEGLSYSTNQPFLNAVKGVI